MTLSCFGIKLEVMEDVGAFYSDGNLTIAVGVMPRLCLTRGQRGVCGDLPTALRVPFTSRAADERHGGVRGLLCKTYDFLTSGKSFSTKFSPRTVIEHKPSLKSM